VSDRYFYERTGPDRFRPTGHVQGAWRDGEQHLAPVCGLLAHAVERHDPRPDLQLARIAFDVLGVIPLDESVVAVRTVRPGRTIELVEATLSVAGRVAVRASAWRLPRHDTAAVAGGLPEPLPPVERMAAWAGALDWTGGYIAALDGRRSADTVPGRARVWLRSDVELVQGEATTPTASFLRLVDTANGVAPRADPREWMFPNVDLTVHLVRAPQGPWVGLDTTVTLGADGLGLTSSWLHDTHGPVGRAEQSLTVRRLPPGGLG